MTMQNRNYPDWPRPYDPPKSGAEAERRVKAYCTEEVERQGHDTRIQDGIERVDWMLRAWRAARKLAESGTAIDTPTIVKIGKTVEKVRNKRGIRTEAVMIAGQIRAQRKPEIIESLDALCERTGKLDPLSWYKAFEQIHPFIDGNGRTGKILLTWLTGRWDDPVFPPNDLFGHPIRNP